MKIKTILCTLCAVTVLGSCSYDDDGLWDAVNGQEERISALEKWQKTVVDQLNSLQGILTATDYVTNVEKVERMVRKGIKSLSCTLMLLHCTIMKTARSVAEAMLRLVWHRTITVIIGR